MNLKELLEYTVNSTKEFEEGMHAAEKYHLSGRGSQDPAGANNPYKKGTKQHHDWNHGWSVGYHADFPAAEK